MSLPTLPTLNPELYRWEKSPTNPQTVQRLGNGNEAWTGIRDANAKGQYDYYLNTTLRIGNGLSSLSLAQLRELLVSALVGVRFQHPEVACVAVWQDAYTPPHIQYTPPKDNTEALAWARDVISVRATSIGGIALHDEIVAKRRTSAVPKSAGPLEIFFIAEAESEEAPVAQGVSADLLVHFNHLYWDAMSSRQFVGDLLRFLGEEWNDGGKVQTPDYNWGEEIANLSVPILDACKVEVPVISDDFKKSGDEYLSALFRMGTSWALNVTNGVGPPRALFHTFSKADSEAIIRAVKSRVGPQYTISHLGHTATMLALLKTRPLPADSADTPLIMPLPVDGRRFLQDEYASKQYGSVQAPAVVKFEKLGPWSVDLSDKDAVRSVLEKGCRHVKESYDYWLSREFLLPLGVAKDNFLSAALSRNPPTFTGSSVPIFVTDGLVDRYVPAEVSSKGGEKLLDTESCSFFLDTYFSDILVRMDSFRGCTQLSICFNDGFIKAEEAQKFLDDITGFMKMLVD